MTSTHIHKQITLPTEAAGQRLDQALAQSLPEYSRSQIQDWIKAQQVTVNGQHLRSKDKIRGGEEIVVDAAIEAQGLWSAQAISLNIVHQDDHILVINKPRGLVVHPGAGCHDNTLLNALLYFDKTLETVPRAGIVHRLDKDTTGLLVVARNLTAHNHLVQQLQAREFHRQYQAVVTGTIISGNTIDAPIGRHPTQRTRMAVVTDGKPAISHYRVLERFKHFTLVKVTLESGRTHQIRVHMAHIKHPLLGDKTYAGRLKIPANIAQTLQKTLQDFQRPALHAWQLGLTHPDTGEWLEWEAPLPQDFSTLLTTLREQDTP